jgi:hypothetical protein
MMNSYLISTSGFWTYLTTSKLTVNQRIINSHYTNSTSTSTSNSTSIKPIINKCITTTTTTATILI